jgi:hypothetical protein
MCGECKEFWNAASGSREAAPLVAYVKAGFSTEGCVEVHLVGFDRRISGLSNLTGVW